VPSTLHLADQSTLRVSEDPEHVAQVLGGRFPQLTADPQGTPVWVNSAQVMWVEEASDSNRTA
jgi:polygalacturonase